MVVTLGQQYNVGEKPTNTLIQLFVFPKKKSRNSIDSRLHIDMLACGWKIGQKEKQPMQTLVSFFARDHIFFLNRPPLAAFYTTTLAFRAYTATCLPNFGIASLVYYNN